MAETNETIFRLTYSGPDVEGGSIGAEELIEALKGFSRAYSRIARHEQPDIGHRVKVVGLDDGSTEIVFSILEWIQQNPEQAQLLKTYALSAAKIVAALVALINVKKHLRKGSKSIEVNGNNNTVVIINSNNERMEVPKSIYEMSEARLVDSELSNLVSPLEETRIESVEIRDRDKKQIEGSKIDAKDRDLFLVSNTAGTTTKDDVWLTGELRSHSKKTDSGLFVQDNGRRVPYKFVGDNPQALRDEYSYPGLVRVRCSAKFDGEMNLLRIEVKHVERIQPRLSR